MNNKYFPDALKNLCPNSEFLIRGDYILSNVNWVKLDDPIPTESEIEIKAQELEILFEKRNCKEIAKKKIAETDWAVLSDVNITNRAEFETYRATLRNLILNPVADPVFPTEPQPVWG